MCPLFQPVGHLSRKMWQIWHNIKHVQNHLIGFLFAGQSSELLAFQSQYPIHGTESTYQHGHSFGSLAVISLHSCSLASLHCPHPHVWQPSPSWKYVGWFKTYIVLGWCTHESPMIFQKYVGCFKSNILVGWFKSQLGQFNQLAFRMLVELPCLRWLHGQRSSRHLNATRTWTGHRCGKWSTRGVPLIQGRTPCAPNNGKYRGRIRRSCTFYIILPWSQQAHVLYVFFPKSQSLVAFNAANLSPAGIKLQAHGNPMWDFSVKKLDGTIEKVDEINEK